MKVKIYNNIVQRCPNLQTQHEFKDTKMKDLHLESPKQSASSSSSALSSTLSHQSMKELLQCSDLDPSQRSDKEHCNSCKSVSVYSQPSKSRTPSPPKRETQEIKISPTSKNKKGKQNPRNTWMQTYCWPSIAPLWRVC